MEWRLLVETAEGVDQDAMGELQSWLGEQDGLRGEVAVVNAPAPEGSMSGAGLVDMLVVAAGSGGALSVLASAVVAWVKQPRGSRVQLTVSGPDGSVVHLDADRVREVDVEAMLRTAVQGAGRDEV